MADTDQVLNLAAIIREVDGSNNKGAAALAESILDHPRFRAVLAGEPAMPEGREPAAVSGRPSDEELLATLDKATAAFPPRHPEAEGLNASEYLLALELRKARAVLARWGNPTPQPPEPGEVGVVVAWLRATGEGQPCLSDEGYARLTRAAELLERQVLVPVAVSGALIKAECALSDIAEGEPMTDEGDPLKWAERRCADTLAIIRPTMMQHKIRTSEWPPVAATAKPLPEVDQMAWQPIDTAPRDGTEILASDYDAIEIVSRVGPRFGEWTNREGEAMYPAWWQPLPDHPSLPGQEVGE